KCRDAVQIFPASVQGSLAPDADWISRRAGRANGQRRAAARWPEPRSSGLQGTPTSGDVGTVAAVSDRDVVVAGAQAVGRIEFLRRSLVSCGAGRPASKC